jgi:4-hydroxy-3-polyprenylbenzoate decarboxylase
VGIVKAKTQDAWSIADSEWVIEGYIDTNQVIWENNEAEAETAKDPKAAAKYFPFFVESNGHVGRARQTYKFVATAVTRRKDGPIYHAPLAHSFEYPAMMTFTNDAALFDVLNRQWPGLVADVNSLPCMMGPLGTVIQVRKRRGRDEDHIRDLIMQTMVTCTSLRMVVVVDEEVDIYDANEVMWAMITRADAGESVMIVPPGGSWSISRNRPISPSTPKYRIGFDCTVPVEAKAGFNRGEFPKVDLAKWFSAADIARMKAMQAEYARVLAEKRV